MERASVAGSAFEGICASPRPGMINSTKSKQHTNAAPRRRICVNRASPRQCVTAAARSCAVRWFGLIVPAIICKRISWHLQRVIHALAALSYWLRTPWRPCCYHCVSRPNKCSIVTFSRHAHTPTRPYAYSESPPPYPRTSTIITESEAGWF